MLRFGAEDDGATPVNYDDQPLPPLSDWLLFAVLMAWKCAPVILVVGVVTMLAVMVSST